MEAVYVDAGPAPFAQGPVVTGEVELATDVVGEPDDTGVVVMAGEVVVTALVDVVEEPLEILYTESTPLAALAAFWADFK